ncbi:ribosomal L1 domain-containing protein 1-like [Durio zibethinus]|uniref:Ribosomal L1 domain-containing protein 1-like n=1 Tax=Durio zibethinus TaxID=66656 RepID=A0A6P5YMJ8_DURZI|nr:ribosomal L1 domain-containing protein 1-like [Durio zibethinus]XP_022741291.1 ribosomal L1 domain-containing protein 1-like [Durio zibethinus]XP_022741292.1 ribosomal L1 domain-containing protein 1-like [Durio zibethinus]
MGEEAASSRVSPKTVEKAVNALLKWRDSQSHTQKPQLLEQDELLYLIVSLKKNPQKPRVNPYKVLLPHPLIDPSTDPAELCMVIDDRPKSGLTKDAASKKIKSEYIPISKVVKLSKLKTDYRPFEAKRKLCDSYDMFFADKRIIPLLPRLLGKQFFKKKKIPVPVDLKHNNWKEQIHKACASAMLFLSSGTCSVVKVGKLSMGKKEIVENVIAAINGIAEIVPFQWGNIRSFHLKLLDSMALPFYQVMPDMRLKILSEVDHPSSTKDVLEENQEEEVEEEEDASHEKKKKKNKGRIHEVQYMDENSNKTNSGAKRIDETKTDNVSNKKTKTALKKLGAIDIRDKKKKKTLAAQ